MSSLRALAGQTALYGLSTMVGRMLNYLLVPLYTILFAPEVYGVVTDLYALVAFLNVVYTYGMETAYFRKSADRPEAAYHAAFWSLTATTVIFTTLLLVASPSLARGLQYPNHPEYVRWFALILGLDALAAIPFARLRQQGKALAFASIKLVNIGLNIGLNLGYLLFLPWLVSQGISLPSWLYRPEMGVGYIFLSNLIANGITLMLLLPGMPRTFRGFDKALWREMAAYGIPLLPAGLAGMVNETLDRALLKYLLPGTTQENLYAVGIYGAVYKLAMLMSLFTQTFRTAAEPFFFQQAKGNAAPALYARIMNYFVLAGGLIFTAVILFLDIVKHFIGSAYHSGLHVVPILLLANWLLGIYYNQSVWYKLADKTRYGMWLSFVGAAVTIVANLALIPWLGYAGSAWATLACYFTMVVLSYYWGQRHYPVPYRLGRITFYLLFALGIAAIEWQFLRELDTPAVWAIRLVLWLAYLAVGWWREKPRLSVT